MSCLFCPKCLADVCLCVAAKWRDLEKENEELKSLLINYQLGFATQTEIRESLEQKLEVAKRALEDIEQIDIDTHKRHPEYEGQWSEYVDVARKALRDMNG